MTVFSNFHTHTNYCDGKSTAEEMVKSAISLGCPAIGFSGHSYTFFDTSYCMTLEDTQKYIAEINLLKEKYADKIEISLGIEQDLLSSESTEPYDFAIGSAHYVKKGSKYLPVDESEAILRDGVTRLYGGDFYAMTRDYFEFMASAAKRTDIDFIGHFDLVSKFNSGGIMFDENSPKYRSPAIDALKVLCENDCIFEVNTGTMLRRLRTVPYPAPFMLRAINDFGGRVILSSDSHDALSLCHSFYEATVLLRHCGFKSVMTLKEGCFISQKI